MFDKLKTMFKGRDAAKGKPQSKPDGKAPAKAEEKTKADKGKTSDAKSAPAKAAPKKQLPPEEMCGITPKMSKDQVREKLALLYKRYNRATSSLDAGLRAEAEEMLDAIVVIREKVFGPI